MNKKMRVRRKPNGLEKLEISWVYYGKWVVPHYPLLTVGSFKLYICTCNVRSL